MSGRQSLAGAFTPVPPTRGAGLQGLLPPKRGRAQAPDPAPTGATVEAPAREPIQLPIIVTPEPEKQPAPDVEQGPAQADEPKAALGSLQAPKTTRQPAKKSAPVQKASETIPGALRNVGVYLPPQLLADVKDAVYRGRTTYADLLIDAFEAVEDERIAREFRTETTLTNSGMPRRAPRKRGESGIQIQLRLDGVQVAWLDAKVKEFDAPSRSALVAAVFKLHMQAGESAGE